MSVEFRGTFTGEHLLRVTNLARRATGADPVQAGAGCFGLAAIATIALGVFQMTRGNWEGGWGWLGVAAVAAALAWWQWWALRRALAKNPKDEMHGTIDDDGFRLVTPVSDARNAWAVATSFLATRDYLLIFIGDTAIGLPRSFFATETEFNAAVSITGAHVKPETRARRRRVWSILLWIVIIVAIVLLWKLFKESERPRQAGNFGRPSRFSRVLSHYV